MQKFLLSARILVQYSRVSVPSQLHRLLVLAAVREVVQRVLFERSALRQAVLSVLELSQVSVPAAQQQVSALTLGLVSANLERERSPAM